MKQKVSVYAMVKQEGKVLLLKRLKGRQDIIGKHELPGGELPSTQTPLYATAEFVRIQTGLEPSTLQLFDVRAYNSQYDPETQRIDIVYLAAIQGKAHVELSDRHNKYIWKKLSEIHQNELTEAASNLLFSEDIAEKAIGTQVGIHHEEDIYTTEKRVIIYSDGGSRGNPGPSASGFVILDEDEQLIEEGGAYLGITTNNQAEYQAVKLALEAAIKRGIRTVQFRIDSLLVVNQMTGIYNIKNRELWPIHERIKELVAQFDKVSFVHVRREFNREADALVNKILNERSSL